MLSEFALFQIVLFGLRHKKSESNGIFVFNAPLLLIAPMCYVEPTVSFAGMYGNLIAISLARE